VGRGIVAIVASPMLRTVETAAIANEFLNLPISYEPDLREVIFGGMEGKPLLPWFTEWLAGRYCPDGAESFAEVSERVRGAMARVLELPGPVLIVSHGGVFRALRGIMGLALESGITPNAVPWFCEHHLNGWRAELKN
jgi:broad specificity phosphatase PhoE